MLFTQSACKLEKIGETLSKKGEKYSEDIQTFIHCMRKLATNIQTSLQGNHNINYQYNQELLQKYMHG